MALGWLGARPEPVGVARHIGRVVLGVFLAFAGTGHLSFARETFQAQVPTWIPVDADLIVVLSGLVEITLGLALALLAKWRVPLGWVAAAFFVAVFPGNLAQWAEGREAFGLDSDIVRLVRLFFQPVLIVWALWCTGAWRASRRHTQDRRPA